MEALLDAVTLHSGDCLEVMPTLPDGSVGMVLTDLPYGTTYAPWDSVLPLDQLWAEWRRLLRPNGAVVMTASQPFTSVCVMSNLAEFRCEWIWDKSYPTNFPNAKKQPLKIHESVLVFGSEVTTYNPQMLEGDLNHAQGKGTARHESELRQGMVRAEDDLRGLKYPQSILCFPKHSSSCKWHSTQKPTELFEYLIRTYSREGEIVLDCCAGSGTTGVAAYQARRQALLIEKDPEIASRIRERFSLPEELSPPISDQEYLSELNALLVDDQTRSRRKRKLEQMSDKSKQQELFLAMAGLED